MTTGPMIAIVLRHSAAHKPLALNVAGCAELAAEINQLLGRIRELESAPTMARAVAKDAARYRFWRDTACNSPPVIARHLTSCLYAHEIDEAIDGLMGASRDSCDYWKPIPDGGIAFPCSCGNYCDWPPSTLDAEAAAPRKRIVDALNAHATGTRAGGDDA